MCLCGNGGGGGTDGSKKGGGVDGSGGNSGVGDGGESIVYRSVRGSGSVVYQIFGGGMCRSGWYSDVVWGFRD